MVHIKLGFVITVSFFRINFRFQANLCKNCHNVLQKNIIFNEISILFVKGNTHRMFPIFGGENGRGPGTSIKSNKNSN